MIFNIGDEFKGNFIASENAYISFTDVFKDRNPIHISEAYAMEKGFKGIVMHGNILNGFISYFIGACLPVTNLIIHSQSIEFKNAFYLNEELQFTAVVTGVYESVNAVEFKYHFRNSESKTVAKGNFQIGILE